MGLTPLDLFNDILIERNDLKNFLGPGNWRESDTIALRKRLILIFCSTLLVLILNPTSFVCSNLVIERIESIKSYLKFCAMTDSIVWQPNVPLPVEIKEEFEENPMVLEGFDTEFQSSRGWFHFDR